MKYYRDNINTEKKTYLIIRIKNMYDIIKMYSDKLHIFANSPPPRFLAYPEKSAWFLKDMLAGHPAIETFFSTNFSSLL